MDFRFLTHEQLIAANLAALKNGWRAGVTPKLRKLKAPPVGFPVEKHVLHGDGDRVRAYVVLTAEGNTLPLDMTLEAFNALSVISH